MNNVPDGWWRAVPPAFFEWRSMIAGAVLVVAEKDFECADSVNGPPAVTIRREKRDLLAPDREVSGLCS
jgi:hypothetical protein